MVLQTKDGEEYLAFRHDNSCLERWVMSYFYIIRNLIYYLLKMQRQGVQGANKRPSCWGWFWTKSYLWDRNQLSALLVTSWKASPPTRSTAWGGRGGLQVDPKGVWEWVWIHPTALSIPSSVKLLSPTRWWSANSKGTPSWESLL